MRPKLPDALLASLVPALIWTYSAWPAAASSAGHPSVGQRRGFDCFAGRNAHLAARPSYTCGCSRNDGQPTLQLDRQTYQP